MILCIYVACLQCSYVNLFCFFFVFCLLVFFFEKDTSTRVLLPSSSFDPCLFSLLKMKLNVVAYHSYNE